MVKILSTRNYGEEARQIAEKYPQKPDEKQIISLLREVQEKYRFLPRPTLKSLAEILDLPIAKLYGPAAFYHEFSLLPQGKVHLEICDGSSCYVKKNLEVYDAIRNRYGLSGEEDTTPDQSLTVEVVSCMGRCGEAPVVKFNGEIITGKTAQELLDMIQQKLEEGSKAD